METPGKSHRFLAVNRSVHIHTLASTDDMFDGWGTMEPNKAR